MSSTNKKMDEDIEKLRMILDNPTNPKIKKHVNQHDKILKSLQQRFTTYSSFEGEQKPWYEDFHLKNLEPQVIIHEKDEIREPDSFSPTQFPEPEVAIHQEPSSSDECMKELVDEDDLFEVETVEYIPIEFIEVIQKQKDIPEKTQIEKDISACDQTSSEDNLPDWEPVNDEQSIIKDTVEPPVEEFIEITAQEKQSEQEFTAEEPIPEPILVNKDEKPDKELEITHEEKQDTAEWKQVEQSKQPELIFEEFSEETTPTQIEAEVEIKQSSEDIATWEPIEENTQPSSSFVEEKECTDSEQPLPSSKESKADLKRNQKEIKQQKKQQQKQQRLEEKKKKQQEKEKKKAEKKQQKMMKKNHYQVLRTEKQVWDIEETSQITEYQEKGTLEEGDTHLVSQENTDYDQEMFHEVPQEKSFTLVEEPQISSESKMENQEPSQKKKVFKILTPKRKSTLKTKKDKKTKTMKSVDSDFLDGKENTDSLKQSDTQNTSPIFTHGDFRLYEKDITTPAGKTRTVRFFSKKTPDEGRPISLPEDYSVKVNKRTGLPYLKKK